MKYGYLMMALLAAGCSQGGSGSGQKPADGVNSKITGGAANALSSQTAVFEASRAMGGNQTSVYSGVYSGVSSGFSRLATMAAFSRNPGTKVAVSEKSARISAMARNGACKTDLARQENSGEPTGGAAAQFAPMRLKMSGPSCPMEINFEMTMAGVSGSPCKEQAGAMSCKFNASVKMTYRVLDQKLMEELDLVSGQMNMTFEIDQTMPSGPMENALMEMVMKGKGSLDAKAVDNQGQAYLVSGSNDINMRMIMNTEGAPPQMVGAAKEQWQYHEDSTGVSSSLSATVSMSGSSADEKYFVDGVNVSAKAYQSEREKLANSMMAFGREEGQQQPGPGDSYPGPNEPYPGPAYPPEYPQPGTSDPQPIPYPTPPAPKPNPNPPGPAPGDRAWICVVENPSDRNVFAGYGSKEFIARSQATQACQDAGGRSCSSFMDCEAQDYTSNGWYCETKNSRTGRVFGGIGSSKTEAAYIARKTCFNKSLADSSACQTVYDSDCVRQ